MTLQYRTRNRWDDLIWQQRIRLGNYLLIEIVDWWCQSGGDFPIDEVIACYLYLFSKRCSLLRLSECDVRKQLQAIVGSPNEEYSKTWPQQEEREKREVLEGLSKILCDAAGKWEEGTLLDPAVETVSQQLVDEIVARGYVIFHHYQSTRRDFGGFYGSG